uniref:Protein disulfide isomerase n=1 Tax=Rhizophora mucronata TaxID=61149 RepID=A0A2P2K1L6_RHIMU
MVHRIQQTRLLFHPGQPDQSYLVLIPPHWMELQLSLHLYLLQTSQIQQEFLQFAHLHTFWAARILQETTE